MSVIGSIVEIGSGGLISGDDLFGRDPSSTTVASSTFTAEQKEIERILSEFLRSSGGTPGGIAPVTGETVTPLNRTQQLSLAGLEAAINQPGVESEVSSGSTTAAGTSDALTAGSQGIQDVISGGATNFDEFFKTNVEQPAIRTFEESIRPAISSRFADQFFGSARREADQSANEDLIRSLTQTRGNLAFQTQQADRDAKLRAAGLAPNQARAEFDIGTRQPAELDLAGRGLDIQEAGLGAETELASRNQQLQTLLATLSGGTQAQQTEQRQLTSEFDQFVREEELRRLRASILNQFLGQSGIENITTVDPGSAGIVGSFIGGVGAGVGSGLVTG